MMVEKVFSRVELLNRIEQAHDKKVLDFCLRYPGDCRCEPTLRIYCELSGGDKYGLCWLPADEAENVGRLIKMDVVSATWRQFDSAHLLTVVVREEDAK